MRTDRSLGFATELLRASECRKGRTNSMHKEAPPGTHGRQKDSPRKESTYSSKNPRVEKFRRWSFPIVGGISPSKVRISSGRTPGSTTDSFTLVLLCLLFVLSLSLLLSLLLVVVVVGGPPPWPCRWWAGPGRARRHPSRRDRTRQRFLTQICCTCVYTVICASIYVVATITCCTINFSGGFIEIPTPRS